MKGNECAPTARVGMAVALFAWLGIAVATLTPLPVSAAPGPSPWCIACGPGWVADILANLVLFAPLGVGLRLAGVRPRHAVMAMALTTFLVELLQLSIVAGRDASISDLASNTLGGSVAYFATRARVSLLLPPRRRAAWLAGAWCLLWIAGTTLTAWALVPSLPASAWWAHWPTTSGDSSAGLPAGGAVVTSASLAGFPIELGPVDAWPLLRPRMLRGSAMRMRAYLPPAMDLASANRRLAVINDADTEEELMGFHMRDGGLSFRLRTRAALVGLRVPMISTPRVPSASPGQTLDVAGAIAGGRMHLALRGAGGGAGIVSVDLTPNWGWRLLAPSDFAARWLRLGTALWVACLVLPIGYWSTHAAGGPKRSSLVLPVSAWLAPAVALLVLPLAFGLPAVHWSEWTAWLAGSLAGAKLAWDVLRRHHAERPSSRASTSRAAVQPS